MRCHLQIFRSDEISNSESTGSSTVVEVTKDSNTGDVPRHEHVEEDDESTIDGLNNYNNKNDDTTEGISSSTLDDANEVSDTPPMSMSNPTREKGEIPKINSKIVYKLQEGDVIRNAIVIGRGGTARGVNKHYFNIQNEDRSLSGKGRWVEIC